MPAPGSPPRAGRRALLLGAGAAGAGVLTGCDLDPRTAPGPATSTPSATSEAPAPAADTVLLAEVGEAAAAARRTVRRTRARHPALRGPLAPLVELHGAHDDVLAQADAAATDPSAGADPGSRVPGDPARARAAVLVAEDAYAAALAGWALRAESGALARLLASMAAGVSMHTTALAAAA